MSELKPCPFCGSMAVVKCRVDSDWGVDLKYRLINDESNYDIKSMIAIESYDPDYQSGDYWDIEIFRCQSCRAEWGEGTDVCVAELKSRIAELEAAQRWRVVADGELPEVYRDEDGDFIRFLVCEGDGGNPFIAMYNGINWWAGIFVPDITHWMPLPEYPNDTQTETFVYG